MNKRTQAYRRFSFGRRANDKKECYICPMSTENIQETAKQIVLSMASSSDFKESLVSALQRDGYFVVVKEELAINKEE